MYLQYYLFFNSDVYTSELATQPPACVFERKWNASAAEKNKMMTWLVEGQGFNTKLYRQLQISVQTDKYITYQIQVQCVLVGIRGSMTGIECFSWRKEYIFGWGVKKQEITEERTEASHLCFFHLIFYFLCVL